jgi:hypothetical protein
MAGFTFMLSEWSMRIALCCMGRLEDVRYWSLIVTRQADGRALFAVKRV